MQVVVDLIHIETKAFLSPFEGVNFFFLKLLKKLPKILIVLI